MNLEDEYNDNELEMIYSLFVSEIYDRKKEIVDDIRRKHNSMLAKEYEDIINKVYKGSED